VLQDAGIERAVGLVLTSDDDVANVHVALVAARLAPGIQIVVRTFDEALGRRVEALVPGSVALSGSALAAPGFVSAILDEADDRAIEVAGRVLRLQPADPSAASTIIPVLDDRVDPPLVLPGRATTLPASMLCLIDAGPVAATAGDGRHGRRRPGVRSQLGRVDRRFWVLGVVLALITLGAGIVFATAAGTSPTDALYAVVAGFFGAVSEDVASTPALKVFAVGLTLVGAAALALFYGLIADVLLSARVRDLMGPTTADARDHIIVVGLGTIGFRVARALRERGLTVAAAERQAEGRFVESARELGIPVVVGDAADPALLRTLRIDRAQALVAATDQDAANLAIALHARGLRDDLRIVVRLFDPDLADRLGAAIGEFRSRSVSALAAPAFAAAALSRRVEAVIPVSNRRVVLIARVPVAPGSSADGSTVAAEEAAATAVALGAGRVIAIEDGGATEWRPSADRVLRAGEEMIVVAARRSLPLLLARADPPH
jgi:Trk K+ transport system NAD-binding subunit